MDSIKEAAAKAAPYIGGVGVAVAIVLLLIALMSPKTLGLGGGEDVSGGYQRVAEAISSVQQRAVGAGQKLGRRIRGGHAMASTGEIQTSYKTEEGEETGRAPTAIGVERMSV